MVKAILKHLPIESLSRGQYQPREYFSPESLQELAGSIASQGLIEPLIVRPVDDSRYELIAGERRWRAAALAGLDEVPCLVKAYTDEQAAAVTLIENIQREDLNVIEEAKGYKRLLDEFFFYQEEVAKMVGKSRAYIANSLRLLELNPSVQQALIDAVLSAGHGKMLVGLDDGLQLELLREICEKQWSVRQLEKQVKSLKAPRQFSDSAKDKDVQRLERLIGEQCGAKAEIEQGSGNGGWLKLKYFDNDTLAGLLEKIGVDYD